MKLRLLGNFDAEKFIAGYIEAALALGSNRPDEPNEDDPYIESFLDEGYTRNDIDETSLLAMRIDCLDFILSNQALLKGLDEYQCGTDLWCERVSARAGFLDRNLGELGQRLKKAAGFKMNSLLFIDGEILLMNAYSILQEAGPRVKAWLERNALGEGTHIEEPDEVSFPGISL